MNCILCGSWFSSTINNGACPTCERAMRQLGLNMTPDRIKELSQAEKDGQLVVLPCRGDTVYTIEEDYFNCVECSHGANAHYQPEIKRVSCDMDNGVHCPFYIKEHEVDGFEIMFDATGNVVLSPPGKFGYEGLEQFIGVDGKCYYTKEEAEAALKKREADNEP